MPTIHARSLDQYLTRLALLRADDDATRAEPIAELSLPVKVVPRVVESASISVDQNFYIGPIA